MKDLVLPLGLFSTDTIAEFTASLETDGISEIEAALLDATFETDGSAFLLLDNAALWQAKWRLGQARLFGPKENLLDRVSAMLTPPPLFHANQVVTASEGGTFLQPPLVQPNGYSVRGKNSPPDWTLLARTGNFSAIAHHLTQMKKGRDPAKYRWGVGSTQHWTVANGRLWGPSFYSALKRSIAPGHYDQWFGENILPLLPQEWRKNFTPRLQYARCPHDWVTMAEKKQYWQIAQLLANLRPHTSPAKHKWGVGAVQYWKTEAGEPWGRAFYWSLRRNIAEKDPEKWFRDHILPHLPLPWQKKYEMRPEPRTSQHDWKKLIEEEKFGEIARLLTGCKPTRDPTRYPWGLYSILRWNYYNEPWGGVFFFGALRRSGVAEDPVTWFEKNILIHFPQEWRSHYRRVRLKFCPHDWLSLAEQGRFGAIADILKNLTPSRDSARYRWGLGSLYEWVEGENPWGLSFSKVLQNSIAPDDPEEWFRQNILPLLPAEWRPNFGTKEYDSCPYLWTKLAEEGKFEEIARILLSFRPDRNPHFHSWRFGSIGQWQDRGKEWGKALYHAIRRTIAPKDPEGWFYRHIVSTKALRSLAPNYRRPEWARYVQDEITESHRARVVLIEGIQDTNERRTKLLKETKSHSNRLAYLVLINDLMKERVPEHLHVGSKKRPILSRSAWDFEELGIKDWHEAVETWLAWAKAKQRLLQLDGATSPQERIKDDRLGLHQSKWRLVFGDLFEAIRKKISDKETQALFALYLLHAFEPKPGAIEKEFGLPETARLEKLLATLTAGELRRFEHLKTEIGAELRELWEEG